MRKMKQMSLAILLLAGLRVHAGSAQPTIEIHGEVYVAPRAPLLLGAMAQMEGLSSFELNRIKNILILEGDDEAERKTISNRTISEILRREIPKFTKRRVELKIPSRVQVSFKEKEYEVGPLLEQMKARAREICINCRFEISNVKVVGATSATNLSSYRLPRIERLPKGSFLYHLVGPNGGGNAKITGELRTFRRVPVLVRPMSASQKLQKEDVRWEERDVTFSFEGIPNEDEWMKRETKQNLQENQILWSRYLERVRGVQRSQSVRALLGDEAWQVSITAVALEGGFLGDVVRVMNPMTKKIFSGELIQEGVVKVQQ